MATPSLESSSPPIWTHERRPAHLAVLDEGAAGHRGSTAVEWLRAVERAIGSMRERLTEPITLQSMADVAILSPYHFNRVFCRVTGVPPGRFLTALRVEAATHLLLSTHFSVTRVCAEVGYQSLGTFTAHFAQLVGLPPRRLRRLARAVELPSLDELSQHLPSVSPAELTGPAVVGWVRGTVNTSVPIFVGLFPGPLAQGWPVACAVLASPGAFHFTGVPDGRYYALAVALPWSSDPLPCLLPDRGHLRVGAVGPVEVTSGATSTLVDLYLRPVQLTDPPILLALPLLYGKHRGGAAAGQLGEWELACGSASTVEREGARD